MEASAAPIHSIEFHLASRAGDVVCRPTNAIRPAPTRPRLLSRRLGLSRAVRAVRAPDRAAELQRGAPDELRGCAALCGRASARTRLSRPGRDPALHRGRDARISHQ